VTTPDGFDTIKVFSFAGRDTTVRIDGVLPWTPDNPNRYRLSFTPFFKGRKGVRTSFLRGFCQLTTHESGLFLNGKPVYLRGMARHDILDLNGKPLTREQRRRDLAEIKELGVNFLRIAHFPQHRDVYELCDSIGLLVMDEIPAWKTDKKYLATGKAREYGSAYMRDLIDMHGNFTCISLWSIGNQFKSYETSVADYVKAVATTVRQTDSSRLVTFCSYYYLWDKAFRYVDVIAINEYFGWELASLGMLPSLLEKIHNEWPDKPVVVTEIGAQAKYGLRNSEARLAGPVKSLLGKDISEDHQALYIGAHLDTIWNKRGFVHGVVVWAYADYMANLNKKKTPDMPFGINSCGIVTADRKKKRAFQVVKQNYSRFMNEIDRITLQTD
jgi:beta-glucuronidase